MKVIIGIDPDIHKSGIAIYSKSENNLICQAMIFFDVFAYFFHEKENIELVKIEASWLIPKKNFRQKYFDGKSGKFKDFSSAQKEKMASDTGENHQVGKKLVEMCEYLKIPFLLIKPLPKIWKGADKKISDTEFRKVVAGKKIKFEQKRTNQEMRDAALICLIG